MENFVTFWWFVARSC